MVADPDLGIYQRRMGFEDYKRLQEEFDLKKAAANQAAQLNALQMQQMQKEIETGVSSNDPAAIREWNVYSQMTPEQKQQYLQMKRSDQIMNLGGQMAVRSPMGGIAESYPVTPKIIDMPEFQAAQSGAQEQAKINAQLAGLPELEEAKKVATLKAEAQGEEAKKALKGENMLNLTQQARQYLPQATSGAISNYLYKAPLQTAGISTDQSQADRQLSVISGMLTSNVPRMEGPQSEYDVALYKEMAGDVGNPNIPINDRLAALDAIDKLNQKYANQQNEQQQIQNNVAPPKKGQVVDGYMYLGGDPNSEKSWKAAK